MNFGDNNDLDVFVEFVRDGVLEFVRGSDFDGVVKFVTDNYLDDIVKCIKGPTTSFITSETNRVLLAEICLKLLLGQNYTNKEMGPIRDDLVNCVKELDPQLITNLITPETVLGFFKV